MRSKQPEQRGLFDPQLVPRELHPVLREKLRPLLQVLLTEAAYLERRSKVQPSLSGREDGDDQDHA